MQLAPSELILNKDGSIYHLNLLPQDLAPIVITVGDPDRVERVTRHFDTITVTKHKREFKTQTGTYGGKAITVISTGIGTDNIDIVLNELDALVNIDFNTRKIKEQLKTLQIIRLGTSGAIQPEIDVDSILLSKMAIGFDSLLHFYDSKAILNTAIQNAFIKHSNWAAEKSHPYVIDADAQLLAHFKEKNYHTGFTATNVGFYAPQGRILRGKLNDPDLNEKITSFTHHGLQITNLEMETSGIYGLAKLLGHQAISINAILANRTTGAFSKNGDKTVDFMIKMALERIKSL
ncbi:MAG TPA: phosphorylase [Leeuwenhoekiella sp.]|nr:phosphorylase [Leeuwenhoekiella sp.]